MGQGIADQIFLSALRPLSVILQPNRMIRTYLLILLAATVALASGCHSTRRKMARLAKSRKLAERDSAATYYYNKKNYTAASILFEELMSGYRSSQKAERVTFLYADCKYQEGEYITAAHYFQQYSDQYPNGKRHEDAMFFVGMSNYKQANDEEHDAAEVKKSLEAFQLFVSVYPDTKRLDEVNNYVKDLRDRLAHKAFNTAVLYHNIGHYKAAVVALRNMMNEFPDSKYREEAQYKLFRSQVSYAEKSAPGKQETRYVESLTMYQRFVEKYPQSKFIREAEGTYETVQRTLKRLQGNKNISSN